MIRFTGESGEEIEEAILNLRQDGAEYLILDLRQNGGGLRDAAVDISEHFLDGGTVVFQTSKDGDEQEFVAEKDEIAEGLQAKASAHCPGHLWICSLAHTEESPGTR